jgi:hypothetical protein
VTRKALAAGSTPSAAGKTEHEELLASSSLRAEMSPVGSPGPRGTRYARRVGISEVADHSCLGLRVLFSVACLACEPERAFGQMPGIGMS